MDSPTFAPPVSILLVMRNERANMERIMPLIEGQDYRGTTEIVYVDSGSTDGTIEYMRSRGVEAHCIPPEEFHHGKTRNYAASLAAHDILVMLSGDAIPTSYQWLRNLVAPFEDPGVGAVYGRQAAPPQLGPLRWVSLAVEYPLVRDVRDPAVISQFNPGHFRFSNVNAAIRRSLWEQFRWNEELLLAEDQGMCRDVLTHGCKVVYEPGAEVEHGHQRSLFGEFQFALDNGLSLTRLRILNNPEFGGATSYGVKKVQEEMGEFLRAGQYINAFLFLLVNAVKWLGVQLGKRERYLPAWFLRHVSETYSKKRS